MIRFASLVLPLLLVSRIAVAVDGVLEINQACATGPGCFAGDDPGFPVKITTPGSYRLTGNLGINNTSGPPSNPLIEISANDVQLDLNGFRLSCVNLLTGSPCASGSASGIFLGSPTPFRVRIHNGAIFGVPGDGILGVNSHSLKIEDITVTAVGGVGIWAGFRTQIRNCMISDSGTRGISTGAFALVADNVVTDSGTDGLAIGESSIVHGNISRANSGEGIAVRGNSVVTGNTSAFNQIGFALSDDAGSGGNAGGLARDNTANFNTSYGITMGANWLFTSNVIQQNNSGNNNDQTTGGIQGSGNVCGATFGCP